MKTKKSELILLSAALFVLLFSACGNKDPEVEPTPVTPEPMVKKYLVEEYQFKNDRLCLTIDWNEDYSQIKRISYTPTGTIYYQIDYDFTYYGDDSIYIEMSTPAGPSFGGWMFFTNYTCYLQNGKIDSVAFYIENEFTRGSKYKYDSQGRLISAGDDYFVWDGENAIEGTLRYQQFNYNNFGNGINPYYTFPYLLESGNYSYDYMTIPLWKNEIIYEDGSFEYEYDEDNYVTTIYKVDSLGNRGYYKGFRYETPASK